MRVWVKLYCTTSLSFLNLHVRQDGSMFSDASLIVNYCSNITENVYKQLAANVTMYCHSIAIRTSVVCAYVEPNGKGIDSAAKPTTR